MKFFSHVALYHYFCGLVMGVADLIPGVSGGTMAWVLGVYPRLIAAIDVLKKPFIDDVRKGRLLAAFGRVDWLLILPLAFGMVSAIVLMVKVIGLPDLVKTYPQVIYTLFFLIILASVPLLLRGDDKPAWRYGWLLLGAVMGYSLSQLVPVDLPDSMIVLFLSGALAISAMLLPGVSGSYILLVLGQYVVVLEAIDQLNMQILLPFAAGCLAGLMSFAKLLDWLLVRYRAKMVWLMGGLLLGTLPRLWVI